MMYVFLHLSGSRRVHFIPFSIFHLFTTTTYTASLPAQAVAHIPPAVHAPVVYPVAGVHLLLPSWLLRLDVVIVRPVDYCPRNPQSALTSQYDPRIWGKQAREGNSVPQILHEMADGTSDFLVLVCREWYHWLSVPDSN